MHDRLGIFYDDDPHAHRLINPGMAFAYRHLEMDTMARANARLLKDLESEVASTTLVEDRVDRAKLVECAGVAEGAAGEKLGGTGDGQVVPGLWAHAAVAKGSVGVAGGTATADQSFAGVCLDGVNPRLRTPHQSRDPALPLSASAAPVEADMGPRWSSSQATQRHEFVRDTQPFLSPTPEALESVKSLLVSLSARDDAGGAAKTLLFNNLLLFGRKRSIRSAHPLCAVAEPSESSCWEAIAHSFSKWWPVWHTPKGAPCRPARGTAGLLRNPSRAKAYSRWCYAVDITGLHEALRSLALRSSRYFAKAELPGTVFIERLSIKDNLRFVVLAGAMLLVASMEREFLGCLKELVASGVGERKVKPGSLSGARCQSFFSDGLTANLGVSSSYTTQPTIPRESSPRPLFRRLPNSADLEGGPD